MVNKDQYAYLAELAGGHVLVVLNRAGMPMELAVDDLPLPMGCG